MLRLRYQIPLTTDMQETDIRPVGGEVPSAPYSVRRRGSPFWVVSLTTDMQETDILPVGGEVPSAPYSARRRG